MTMAKKAAARAARPGASAERAATGNYHTHALTRGLLVLELLGREAPPLTLQELHEGSGLPKSTLVRLLSALADLQFVVRVDERPAYRLGHKVMDLATAYVASLDISQVAGGYLAELAAETRQTSNLGVLDGDQVLHVCVRVPDRPLRFDTAAGARAHTHSTGLGKMLLAGLAESQVANHVAAEPFEAHTDHTIRDMATLEKDLRKTAKRGHAFDDNEHSDGLRCLAVPVPAGGAGGELLAAVSVSGPSAEFGTEQQKRYLEKLHAIAGQLGTDPEVVNALRNVLTQTRGFSPG